MKSLDIAGSTRGVTSLCIANWASLSPALLAQVLVSLDREEGFSLVKSFGYAQTYTLTVRPNDDKMWNIFSFTPENVTSLLTEIADSSVMNTKSLRVDWKIPHISPELLSRAVTKLERFEAPRSRLTADQISAVFTSLSATKEHKLEYLDLRLNDLVSVPADIMAAGISGLEAVLLNVTQLTGEQLSGIYRMVADRRCSRLREIKISRYHPSSISQDIQDRAKLNESVKITVW